MLEQSRVVDLKLNELFVRYDLEKELVDLVDDILRNSYISILLQFPDGLKPYASKILGFLKLKFLDKCSIEEFNRLEFMIYFGSCFGACDLPQLSNFKVDLLVQFGHSVFVKEFW